MDDSTDQHPRKQASPGWQLFDALTAWLDEPGKWLSEILYKVRHLPQTNYNLAVAFAKEGKTENAIFRFKVTQWLAPQLKEVHYQLGACYLSLGDKENAITQLKEMLRHFPDHHNARFLLASTDPSALPDGEKPKTMPPQLAAEYFGSQAFVYDEIQKERDYRGHIIAAEWIAKRLDSKRLDYEMLDLGCGTGLVGSVLHPYMAHIAGVDIAREMGEIAAEKRGGDEKRVYDDVLHHDLRDYLASVKEPLCDVVTLIHVTPFLGDMTGIMEGVARALRPGGLCALTYDAYPGTQQFALMPATGKFGHADAYISDKLNAAGLEQVGLENIPIYPDQSCRLLLARKA